MLGGGVGSDFMLSTANNLELFFTWYHSRWAAMRRMFIQLTPRQQLLAQDNKYMNRMATTQGGNGAYKTWGVEIHPFYYFLPYTCIFTLTSLPPVSFCLFTKLSSFSDGFALFPGPFPIFSSCATSVFHGGGMCITRLGLIMEGAWMYCQCWCNTTCGFWIYISRFCIFTKLVPTIVNWH